MDFNSFSKEEIIKMLRSNKEINNFAISYLRRRYPEVENEKLHNLNANLETQDLLFPILHPDSFLSKLNSTLQDPFEKKPTHQSS